MRGNAENRRKKDRCHLPCAGITLIRFYGFDLSRIIIKMNQHPGKTLKFWYKINESDHYTGCNFLHAISYYTKPSFMKKTGMLFFLLTAFIFSSFAQNTINDPLVEKRTIGSFHGIDVATGIELVLTKGNTEEVAVSASEAEFRNKIVTEVVDGILMIHYETKTGAINKPKQSKDLKAWVSYTKLDYLKVTTGADVKFEDVLESDQLELNANTGGLVNGEVSIGKLKVDQNTGSVITLTGNVNHLEASGNTGSKFMGEQLITNTCKLLMSTGAGVYINVEKEMEVKANTGGYIKYKGNAGIRDIKTNTGGFVSKI